jgi:putative membrane protein
MEATMKHLIGVMALASAVCAAPVAARALAGGTPRQTGTTAGTPQAGTPARGAVGDDHRAAQATAAADATFVRTAAMDGMAEVEHGRLAVQNATHDEVKQFGQRMVDDHSKAGDELKGLAAQKRVTLPSELDAKHKAMHDTLSKMKGAAFDRAYMAHMVSAHQQAVALFEKEAGGGKDADVKAWAAKTLPTLQEHLKMARGVNAKVGSGAKPSGSAAQ